MFQDFSLICFIQQIFWLSSCTPRGSLFLLLFKLCPLLVNRNLPRLEFLNTSTRAPFLWNHFYLSLTPEQKLPSFILDRLSGKVFSIFLPANIQFIYNTGLLRTECTLHFLSAPALASPWRFDPLGQGST